MRQQMADEKGKCFEFRVAAWLRENKNKHSPFRLYNFHHWKMGLNFNLAIPMKKRKRLPNQSNQVKDIYRKKTYTKK